MKTTNRPRSFRPILLTIAYMVFCFGLAHAVDVVKITADLTSPDAYTLVGDRNFVTGYEPIRDDGDINVVVEIPAGTIEKWEVVKPRGEMKWEFKNGTPRIVEYIGYPGNYGMVPKTLLPEESGGDGDPLDVIVLGPPVKRGSVVKARLIGVLKLLDQGERDDKLIAVLPDSPFHKVTTLTDLNDRFHGVSDIIRIWFSNYKGPGKMVSQGFGDEKEAARILDDAIKAFSQSGEK